MSWLEKTAYLCLISLCFVSGAVIIRHQLPSAKAQTAPSGLDAKLLVGQHTGLPFLQESNSELSAVLFLSTKCHLCDESMPFYERLVDARHRVPASSLRLLGVSREPATDLEQHLLNSHVAFDKIYQIPNSFNLLKGTPTILFVDREGVIRHAFVGKLNKDQEGQVLAVMDGRG